MAPPVHPGVSDHGAREMSEPTYVRESPSLGQEGWCGSPWVS